MVFITNNYYATEKEQQLRKENKMLVYSYLKLNETIDKYTHVISKLQIRDDKIYRTVLDIESIPAEVRNAGFGGTNKYSHINGFESARLVKDIIRKTDILQSRINVQLHSYNDIVKKTAEWNSRISRIPAIMPISVRDFHHMSSAFGVRERHPIFGYSCMHNGIDLVGRSNCSIYAAGKGKITFAGYSSGYGNLVEISHGFGYKTRYAHLKRINVNVGEEVLRGQIVGTQGNTGRSTGPHLHYEVHYMNKPINPYYFLSHNITSAEYDTMIKYAQSVND